MKKAIYPGSFDPVTVGHLDIIKRAASLADELIVAVLINENKKPFFSLEERIDILKKELCPLENVKVTYFKGLLVDFAIQQNINTIIRGVRGNVDFEYEFQMAQTNKALSEGLETVFLITDSKYSHISSSTVKEIASFGGDISSFVPYSVECRILDRLRKEKKFKYQDRYQN